MTIKLGSLSRWRPFMGHAVILGGTPHRERQIRLHFNCESETAIYRVFADTDDQQLITVVPAGNETVEFHAAGEVRFIAVPISGTEVWYQTADIEPTYIEVDDPAIFTRIAARRHRNPELEEIMYRMQENMERRFAMQAHEFEAALQRRRDEENAKQQEQAEPPSSDAGSGGEEVRSQEPTDEQSGETFGGDTAGKQPGDTGSS